MSTRETRKGIVHEIEEKQGECGIKANSKECFNKKWKMNSGVTNIPGIKGGPKL